MSERHPAHRQIALTRAGLWAERLTRAFWPAWTALFVGLAAHASGLIPPLWEGSALIAAGLVALVFLVLGLRSFRAPTTQDARDRLDATLPGRPLAALHDDQAVGAADPASAEVWAAHRRRMARRAEDARAVAPDLRVSQRDPYALRYVALLLLLLALPFGTLFRVPQAPALPGVGTQIAAGPAWEAWLEPPRHTGLPTLYLNEIDPGPVEIPEGTQVTLRLYGEVGAQSVTETVSGRTVTDPTEPLQDFTVTRSGTLTIDGPGDDDPTWSLSATPDAPPSIALDGTPDYEHPDTTIFPWQAQDDFGILSARATLTLDLDAVERRHGLAVEPEGTEPLDLELPLPISGDRTDLREVLREDLTLHPLAGLPVTATLTAVDAAEQQGTSEEATILPARPFYDPTAAALVEMRRDLLWSRENRARTAQILRAVTWNADGAFDGAPSAFLIVRMAIRRLSDGDLTIGQRDEIADMLWQAATRLEDGSLDGALERLRQAQERLSEAIRNGASEEEIARLTEEMRRAMDDYTRQLAQQQQDQGQQQADNQGETREVTPDMLDQMMERIEELMRQGRTAEAQELLRQLQEMMENLQVAQGQGGQGQPQPGQQAMDDLRDTLREQQELSDDSFRELQEQFEPQQGLQGQQGQEGQQGQQPQGQQPGQQPGQQQGQQPGQQGQQPGQGQPQGRGEQPGRGEQEGAQSGAGQGEREGEQGSEAGRGTSPAELAERQRELRRALEGLERQVPGGADGDEAREALGRAGRAMDEAERDLAQGDLGGALDDQAEAMDALRDGMQALGRAFAGEQQPPRQGQGQASTTPGDGFRRDPLGRDAGQGGPLGTEESYLDGPDAARRARDLLEELRRRSGERERPDVELDYIDRLLDRF